MQELGARAATPQIVAPDIILVIGDFMQFMTILAIYEQRTSGLGAFCFRYRRIHIQLKLNIVQINRQLYPIRLRYRSSKLLCVLFLQLLQQCTYSLDVVIFITIF